MIAWPWLILVFVGGAAIGFGIAKLMELASRVEAAIKEGARNARIS